VRYDHSSATYPGNHNSGVSCLDCHKGNNEYATWEAPSYKPDCAGCHASDYKEGPHKKVDDKTRGIKILYRVDELRDCAGSCHQYSDPSFTTIIKWKSGKHHPGDGKF